MTMAWQSQQLSSSCTAPMQPITDSFFARASVSHSTALSAARGGDLLPPPKPGFQLPPPASAFEHFPVDSRLLERAARSSSCFGGGNGTVSAGAFNAAESISPDSGHHDDAPGAEAAAGDCSDSKNMRRSYEVIGTGQAKATNVSTNFVNETERSKGAKGEENGPTAAATATAGKSKGKGAKEADEPQKEGYIHVRARKGQATNSHSLAERLRREKISERMKLLQDLVPGCSKVTGKAVMLDEIINYVQSLQSQVEFLSMKLATVNPRLDFNLESLLSKDVLRFPGAPSSTPIGFSFSPEMMPKLQLSQSGMLQGGVHGMANPDVFRTVMQGQLNERDAFREPASQQVPHTMDGTLHDAVQMAYLSVIGSQDLSIRPDQDGFHM